MKNVIPLVMETTGGYGKAFRNILKILCKKVEMRKQIKFEILINRIKSKLSALLQYNNAQMVLSSLIL